MEVDRSKWIQFEDGGNVGAQIVTNPWLFEWMDNALFREECLSLDDQENSVYKCSPYASVLDIGAGTGSLGREYLLNDPREYFLVEHDVEITREIWRSVKTLINVDNSIEYLKVGQMLENPSQAKFVCAKADNLPLPDSSIDLVVSRHMLMHLSDEEVTQHFAEIERVLRDHCYYIFSIANPAYEQQKHGGTLVPGQKYQYKHGGDDSAHFLDQYFRDTWFYGGINLQMFDIPIFACAKRKGYEVTHPRYYQKEMPVAIICAAQKLPPRSYTKITR